MATVCGRAVFADVTNVTVTSCKKTQACAATQVEKSAKTPLVDARLSESLQEVLDDQAASDEVLAEMGRIEASALCVAGCWSTEDPPEQDNVSLPLGVPARSAAVWMLGHLVEHMGLQETRWLDTLLLLDLFCLHRPQALEENTWPALCTAIARIVRKLDDAEPTEALSNLHHKATSMAQWLQRSGYSQVETWVTMEDLRKHEEEVLTVMQWSLKLPTVQDWLTVLCARLNVFTRNAFMHFLTRLWTENFHLARLLATHCPTTSACGPRRLAHGLLCLGLVSARVLPAAAFGLSELAVPVWEGSASGQNQQQCKQESLEFLLDRLQATTGSDIDMLHADTHLVNETLLILRSSAN